jgi:integrase
VRRELLTRNPFGTLKSSAIAADRSRYVTPEETTTILDACPSLRWRVLFGLARLAGLRTPSETHRLTWADVDWDRKR